MGINIVLLEPEIPQNTGNIARSCVATKSKLHLIRPLGFQLNEKAIKRAGLDYWDKLDLVIYDCFDDFCETNKKARVFMLTTKSTKRYSDLCYNDNDFFMFGKESKGIPNSILEGNKDFNIRIPMDPDSRSLNLSNAVSIVMYEALRQLGFPKLYP